MTFGAAKQIVEIVEVGPRDGLQNEHRVLDTATKLELIERLVTAGLRRIEVASFVNPLRVPQMADADDLVARLPDRPGVTYVGVVLNARGAERAVAAGIDEIGAVATASDAFGLRNQRQTSDESVQEVGRVAAIGANAGIPVQAAIAMAFGCPFQGRIEAASVVDLAKRLGDLPIRELSLADTVGFAVPAQVADLFGLVGEAVPHLHLRAHFHDTRNTGVANVWAAVCAGVGTVDASVAGLGGCPFAPGATGNVATEDVAWLLGASGCEVGVELPALLNTSAWISTQLQRNTQTALLRAMGAESRRS